MDDVMERFKRLFDQNDPKKGGSFYLQSKILRARERIELEGRKQRRKRKGGRAEGGMESESFQGQMTSRGNRQPYWRRNLKLEVYTRLENLSARPRQLS